MVDDLGLANIVTFVGFLPREQYWGLLHSVDMLVLPKRWNLFPITSLEALAYGKPIITTKVGGIPNIVEHGRNDILIQYDITAMADVMLGLHDDPELRGKMLETTLRIFPILNFDKLLCNLKKHILSLVYNSISNQFSIPS